MIQMGDNFEFNQDEDMNEMGEKRLWKFLESFGERLTSIEEKLEKVVRLEIQVENHSKIISRYGNKIDKHDETIHEIQLWQATLGDKSSIDRLFKNLRSDLDGLRSDITSINLDSSSDNGAKSIISEIIKWVFVIIASIVVYNLTGA